METFVLCDLDLTKNTHFLIQIGAPLFCQTFPRSTLTKNINASLLFLLLSF